MPLRLRKQLWDVVYASIFVTLAVLTSECPPPALDSSMDLKPCRDCRTPVPWTSRSCPHCGILNPVAKWVALPDGADETFREPVNAGRAAVVGAVPTGVPERAPGVADPLADARKKVVECAGLFYFIAVINAVAAYWLGPALLVVAVAVAGLATWLRMRNSSGAAGLLLLLAIFHLFLIGRSLRNPGAFSALLAVIVAWRALNATRVLPDTPSSAPAWVALTDESGETFRVPAALYTSVTSFARSAAELSGPTRTTLQRVFGPVRSVEDAREAVNWCSVFFFVVAAINSILGLSEGRTELTELLGAAVLPALAIWLRLRNSRGAAATLLVLSGLAAMVFLSVSISYREFPGIEFWISLIAAGLSWRAFNAAGLLEPQRG